MVTQFAPINLPMSRNAKLRHRVAAAMLAVSLAAMLAGCAAPGGTSDDKMGRFLVAPDKFVLYSCPQLAERATALSARQAELQGLIAKAGPDSGGRLVSAVAYRPEYIELQGEMNELRKAALSKNCKPMPGAENPGGSASERAVR